MHVRLALLDRPQDFLYVVGIAFCGVLWFGVYGFIFGIARQPAYRWLAGICAAGALGFFLFVFCMLFFFNPHESALDALFAMSLVTAPFVLCCHLVLAVIVRLVQAGQPIRASDWDRIADKSMDGSDDEDTQ
jgi:hypothetical protein